MISLRRWTAALSESFHLPARWQCMTTISIVQLCTMFHYPFSVASMYTLNHLIILTSDWKPLWDKFSTLREIFVGNFSCFCKSLDSSVADNFLKDFSPMQINISPSLAMIIRPNWHNWKKFHFICLWLLSGLLKITFHWLWVEFQLQAGGWIMLTGCSMNQKHFFQKCAAVHFIVGTGTFKGNRNAKAKLFNRRKLEWNANP